jgi:hypothetical protein
MKNIPLIIPNFNQLTYLKNLINWWHWYNPGAIVFIIDNASTYKPLLDFYAFSADSLVDVRRYQSNDMGSNLRSFIDNQIKDKFDYYVLSDPDIMPHPNTPYNFLEQWMGYIKQGFHRVGFNLIIEDLPSWLYHKDWIIGDEKALLGVPVLTNNGFDGYRAPIDTTFALYTTKNSGWYSPMNGEDWSNSLRLFNAFHLGWYVDGENLNPEMDYYFKSARYRVPGQNNAGCNNYRPFKFIEE